MQPSDLRESNAAETRMKSISNAVRLHSLKQAIGQEHTATTARREFAMCRKSIFVAIAPLRLMPKVDPRGMNDMIASIAKSTLWPEGSTFEILNLAMKKGRHQWYRVASIDEHGASLEKGFVIDTALISQGGWQ